MDHVINLNSGKNHLKLADIVAFTQFEIVCKSLQIEQAAAAPT